MTGANFLGVQKAKPIFIPSSEKVCSRCGISKPLSGFNKSKKDKLGVQNTCRTCQGIYFKERIKNIKLKKAKQTLLKKQLFTPVTSIEKPEQIKALPTKIGTPDNTSLFLNWINKDNKKQFDIRDFIKEYPDVITMESAKAIMSHQITKNMLQQLSNTAFKVV